MLKITAILFFAATLLIVGASSPALAKAKSNQDFVRLALVSLNGLPPNQLTPDLRRSYDRWSSQFKKRIEQCAHKQLMPTTVDYFDDIELPSGLTAQSPRTYFCAIKARGGGGGDGADWKFGIIQQVGNSLLSYNAAPTKLPFGHLDYHYGLLHFQKFKTATTTARKQSYSIDRVATSDGFSTCVAKF